MALRDIYPDARQARYQNRTTQARAPTPGFLSILWRRKLLILASILGCLGIGIAYIALTPPRYAATAAMLIDPRLGKTVGSDPNVPGFVADTAAIDSQIKLFTSQTVLSRVAAQTDLKNDPEFNGTNRSLLQRILHPAFNAVDGVDLKALEDAITIKRPERTYVVQIDVLARDPRKAAAIANAVTQAYIDDQVSSRVGSAKEDTQYVSEKLDKLSVQIRDIDNKIEAYKGQNKIIETSGLRSNEQQVTDLTKALGDARARESDTKARLAEIDRMAKQGRLASSSEALKSQTIERLRQQQGETEQNTARLSKTLGARHPEMIEVRERQTRLRELIRDELERVKNGLDGDYQAARANEKQILGEIDQVKTQSSEMSRKLVPPGPDAAQSCSAALLLRPLRAGQRHAGAAGSAIAARPCDRRGATAGLALSAEEDRGRAGRAIHRRVPRADRRALRRRRERAASTARRPHRAGADPGERADADSALAAPLLGRR